jgi:hypothetical protein
MMRLEITKMYKITVSYDGNGIAWSHDYADALEAFQAFDKFTDIGFANEYKVVNLSLPTGKMYTKRIDRYGKVYTK